MKIFKFKYLVFVLILIAAQAKAYNAPSLTTKFKNVELKEFTTLTLNIMPHVGTQLIFPFMLDDPLLTPQLKLDLTNNTGFSVPAAMKGNDSILVNQNTITIIGNPTEHANLGTLFVNIGGYNISIALRTVYKSNEISPSVIFDISKEDREHLITHTVNRFKKSLNEEHAKAMAKVDDTARNMALAYVGEVALAYPKTSKYVIEKRLDLDEGRLTFFADKMLSYENFSVIAFEIENPNGHDIRIDDIEFYSYETTKDEVGNSIRGKALCPEKVLKGQVAKCSFTTTAPTAKTAAAFSATITTDIGTGVAKW